MAMSQNAADKAHILWIPDVIILYYLASGQHLVEYEPLSHLMTTAFLMFSSEYKFFNQEFVDEEEYYEELDAMDDMDNLDIDFN